MVIKPDLALREFVLMYYFEIKNDFEINGEKYLSPLLYFISHKDSKLSNKENLRKLFIKTQDAYSAILEFQKYGY